MEQISWQKFNQLKGHEKKPYFEKNGEVFHVIIAQQFDREFLDRICALATKIRGIAKEEGLAEKMAWMMNFINRPAPIINGGSGKDQHPIQALLDIYTLYRSFENYGGINGIKIAMVGDLARGRTVRSLSYLLHHYKGVRIYFVAPPQLRMRDDIKTILENKGLNLKKQKTLRR